MRQSGELSLVQCNTAFFLQFGRNRVRQRQIHVVATKKRMVADGKTLQRQIAFLSHDRNKGEVGSSAADVTDKDDITVFHLFPPSLLIMGKP